MTHPFTKDIPGLDWVKMFIIRNPNVTLRMAYVLEKGRAKGVCPKNVASLYDKLSDVYFYTQ